MSALSDPTLVDAREHRFQLGVVGALTLALSFLRQPRLTVLLPQELPSQCYLRSTGASSHPLLARRGAVDERVVFFKDTTDYRYPDVLDDHEFLRDAHHAFLFRHPDQIVASYAALKPDMTRHDVGLESLVELLDAARLSGSRGTVVIDSDDLVRQPERTMAAYSAGAGIPDRQDALHWEPGDLPEWRRTARWHVEVSASTTLVDHRRDHERTVENAPALAELSRYHQPAYDRLRRERLVLSPTDPPASSAGGCS